ncbi:hypothetical protein ASD89_04695 [Caulobacter sp. Root656]|nr:hypothetical protein ASD89_04695 [Caulobacter sp. Root656]
MRGLEAEVEVFEAKLAEAPPDVRPNVAELYRRKVERLSLALDRLDERDEPARALIDRIVLEPGVPATRAGMTDGGGWRRDAL